MKIAPVSRGLNAWSDRTKAMVICLLAFLIYGSGIGREFEFDDIFYISQNAILKQANAFHLFWFTSEAVNYYPLFWSLLRIQWLLWGDVTTGYHLLNLLLHSANAVLVWRIARAWRLPGAWWAGALFAVHPINVQTVAWAAEQKNTWSFFFMALALLAFIKYAREKDWRSYGLSLLCFFAALACKTSTMSLPLFLALCYGFPKGKLSLRPLLPLIPFFLMSIAGGGATLWCEKYKVGVHSAISALTFWQKAKVAGADFWFYFGKAVAPVGLTPMYRGWTAATAAQDTAVPLLLLVLALAACAIFRRRMGAPVALGFAYYFLMLFPLLGIFDTNYFEFSMIADHWQYHALPGIIVAFISLVTKLAARLPRLAANSGKAGALTVGIVAVLSCVHFTHFEDSRTLWTYVTDRNPDAWLAWYNLGNVYSDAHEYPGAIDAYQRSLQLSPGYDRARFNLAAAYASAGRLAEANDAYLAAEQINDADAAAYNNRAVVLLRLGQDDGAIPEFERALQLDPDKASAHTNLIIIFLKRGQVEKAEAHLRANVVSNDADCRKIANALIAEAQAAGEQKEALVRFAARACSMAGNQPDLLSALQTLRAEQPAGQ